MVGGKYSRLALLAATGMFAGAASVNAADLGGNCCADLEERVAELEATTARKGNRKVSLTVSGHVNEEVLFWDDGHERNAYIGTNLVAQTRFRFVGQAKITSVVTAGYLLEIGTGAPEIDRNNANNDDVSGGVITIRHSAWWLEHKDLGRVWVGQTSQATDGITEINLANMGHFASQNSAAMIGGFSPVVKGTAVPGPFQFYQLFGGNRDARNTAQIGEGNRLNVIKYESPAIFGFIASASVGEDDMWDAALRYAGEFYGFKIAAGIGYEQWTDGNPNGGGALGTGLTDRSCALVNNAPVSSDMNCQQLGLSASLMHVPTGLFVTGAYGWRHDGNVKTLLPAANNANKDDSTQWLVQAGIEQNWFGIGRTTLFGEFQQWSVGPGASGPGTPSNGLNLVGTASNGVPSFASARTNMWGIGLNQSIDAAAMDLYVLYHNYNDIHTTDTAGAATGYKDFQAIMSGAIIKF